ncbi:MAG: hypothetical protein ACRBK7_09160 [Acidimicrobiales bacterium]
MAVAICITWLGLLPGDAGAITDDPDVDTFAAYEYRIDPDRGVVDVTINMAVTADKPNRTLSSGDYYEYYFQGYFLAVPEEAIDLRVTDAADRALNFEVNTENEGFSILDIDFRRNIFYRQTADVVVTYSLPKGEARSDAPARVNEAYAGFSIWLTPQLEGASVTVVSPKGFDNESTGSEPFKIESNADETLFIAEDVDPEDYWALVSLARDQSLTTTELSIAGNAIEVSAWPDDAAWSEHVTINLEQGLPRLIETVGQPWPIDGELAIIESYSPYLLGYAGWYDPTTNQIEIGDELDSHLVFHELSHVWFNDELFGKRWITEGLSDVFGAAVVESMDQERPRPPSTSLLDPIAGPLNEWSQFDRDPEVESWSYDASWTVTEAIAEAVGIEVLSDVVQAAAEDEISYLGDGPPESDSRDDGWRRYLDLIENRGAVTDDSITDLFSEWVVPDPLKPMLAKRSEHRGRYGELVERGETWAAPHAVRVAMSEWEFDDADDLMAASEAILDRRELVYGVLAPLEASLPAKLEADYEHATSDLRQTSSLMTEVEDSADQLRRSYEAVESVSGPLQWVGALGTDYPTDFDEAVSAFERGNLTAATAQSRAVDEEVADLRNRGLFRVISVAVGVLLCIGLLAVILSRRRYRRRLNASVQVSAAATEADSSAS